MPTNYSGFTPIASTAIATLAAGEWAQLAIVDNTVIKYDQVFIGGYFNLGAAHVADNDIGIYLYGNYDPATGGALTGSLGGLDGTDKKIVEGTDFTKENIIGLKSILVRAPSITQHWGPLGIAGAFDGVVPPKWSVIVHNNGAGAMPAGSLVGYLGITFE